MNLTGEFINELFKLAFMKKSVAEILATHLKYQYIPNELREYKKLTKAFSDHWLVHGKIPTYGVISQLHATDHKLQSVLAKIKETRVADSKIILAGLEEFIKKTQFQILLKKTVEMYNEGRHDEAMKTLEIESGEVNKFTVKSNTGQFTHLFKGFEQRLLTRQGAEYENDTKEKIPFGIDPLDEITFGGIDSGDTVLWIMRSGTGKSTALKWTGVHAALLGYNVLHVQAEGSKTEAEDKYDQVWTNSTYSDIKYGNLNAVKIAKLQKLLHQVMSRNRDLLLYGFEQFNEPTMKDVRDLILDYHKINGFYPDLLILDYLELFNPGDGIKYGVDTQSIKMKLTNSARKMKNLCMEFEGMRVITATQTGDIHPSNLNDPQYVITRADTKGDKNLIDSFSYVFTGNQTRDENRSDIMRIFVDKLRNYRAGQVVKIYVDFKHGRFYRRKEVEEAPVVEQDIKKQFSKARKKVKNESEGS